MPKRSISQRIGDQAEHIAQGAFLNAKNWICRTQTHDFGIDLEAELIETVNGAEELSGAIINLQVKGALKPIFNNRGYYVRLKTEYLRYANQFKIPVLLLLVNIKNKDIYFLWLQEYLIEREDIMFGANSVLVRIPEENILERCFQRGLLEIALGVTGGSQLMAVQKLFEVFSSTYDYTALDLASSLLKHLGDHGHVSIFNSALDKLIRRGPHLSRVGSQEFGKVLADLTRRFGDKLSATEVLKMIVRGDTYSWAGLDGLLGLYDSFPDHAKSLELANRFDEIGFYELSWYCRFREAHAEMDALTIWGHISTIKTEFPTKGGVLFIPDEVREHCYLKWPNRADMVYLQSLRFQEV
ncbi:hypothetical protein H4S14_001211 [Agrobacterium vitis]|nr:hypothetical protein [Agrobacterium vitis]MBE1437480.1 hypothetical protein [Agrobacterium vitis]